MIRNLQKIVIFTKILPTNEYVFNPSVVAFEDTSIIRGVGGVELVRMVLQRTETNTKNNNAKNKKHNLLKTFHHPATFRTQLKFS